VTARLGRAFRHGGTQVAEVPRLSGPFPLPEHLRHQPQKTLPWHSLASQGHQRSVIARISVLQSSPGIHLAHRVQARRHKLKSTRWFCAYTTNCSCCWTSSIATQTRSGGKISSFLTYGLPCKTGARGKRLRPARLQLKFRRKMILKEVRWKKVK